MAFSKEKAHDRAEKFAAKGQHDRAAREYQAIVEHDPKDVRAWLMLADSLARTGDRAGAVSRYQQVADYYATQREFQKALAVYRQVLNLDPARLDIHRKCASLNLEVGRVHDAIASFESIAQAQLSSGRIREALDTYRTIADADPSVVSKRLRLAELYSREKMLDEAVAAFREAGAALLEASRHADFVRVAERLIYHKPDDKETVRELARVYLQLGDARRALLKLNGLLQSDAEDAQGLELLAETFMALGKPDKASSVIAELVKSLRAAGEDAEAQRALETGLDWIPGQPDLLALQSSAPAVAPGPSAGSPAGPSGGPSGGAPPVEPSRDPLELDVDDSDVVELDETDFELTEAELEPDADPAPGAVMEAQPDVPSITDHVLSEADDIEGALEPEGLTDFDKVLFEARVYVKYRLFEHALEHVQMLLESQPDHVGALSLRARSLAELERTDEAADAHVAIARLVGSSDPRLADEHLAAALQAVPGHPEASALNGRADEAGDSGAFDLLGDSEDDIAIEVAEFEPTGGADVGSSVVENRFGISEAGPLPEGSGPQNLGLAPTDQMEALRRSREQSEGTPPSGFVARAPLGTEVPRQGTAELTLVDLDSENDAPTGEIVLGEQTAVDMESMLDLDSGLLELSDEDEAETGEHRVPELEPELEVELDDPEPEPEPEVELDDPEPELEPEPEPVIPVAVEEEPPTEPHSVSLPPSAAPAGPPAGGWADLDEDLAEIRFYLDQGLEDDAAAGLADLAEQHPGHPGILALQADLSGAQQPPESDSGATPLVDLDTAEDEDEDAFLAAMFSDDASPKTREVEVSAKASDVAGADAQTHFDLGMAYREMGLVDAAIAEFEAACADPQWLSRALVMSGTLRVHRGDTEGAAADLARAIKSARNEDERCQANYELAVVYEKAGDTEAATRFLHEVTPGYRERDAKLAALQS